MNTEFAQLKMEDLRKELPEMVRSLEAYRQGSNNTLPDRKSTRLNSSHAK